VEGESGRREWKVEFLIVKLMEVKLIKPTCHCGIVKSGTRLSCLRKYTSCYAAITTTPLLC